MSTQSNLPDPKEIFEAAMVVRGHAETPTLPKFQIKSFSDIVPCEHGAMELNCKISGHWLKQPTPYQPCGVRIILRLDINGVVPATQMAGKNTAIFGIYPN